MVWIQSTVNCVRNIKVTCRALGSDRKNKVQGRRRLSEQHSVFKKNGRSVRMKLNLVWAAAKIAVELILKYGREVNFAGGAKISRNANLRRSRFN